MNDQQKQFILAFLAYAAQRELPIEKLCSLSGLSLESLSAGQPPVLGAKQLNDLWLNACHQSNDPLFGMHFGESLQLAALGIVGEIVKSSTTVGQAVEHAVALVPLITDLFAMEVETNKKTLTLRIVPNERKRVESPFAFQQMIHFFMVFAIHELDGLILARIKPESVTLPHEPAHSPEFERVLRCRPAHSQEAYAITFDNKYLDLPILTANYELQRSLLEKVASDTAASERKGMFQKKVQDYLMKNAYLGIASLEEMASNFNVSPRSLQRKLKEEDVTYQELADEVRKSLALHYLSSGSYYVKEVSYMLGYNELSAFSRAFKRWTGKAPGEWRGAHSIIQI